MRFIRWWRKHNDVATPARYERKASLGRIDTSSRAKRLAQTTNLYAQACAMRFIGVLSAERPREQHSPRRVAGPSFGKRAGEGEQHRACLQRNHRVGVTDHAAAGIDDERLRHQQCFDFAESQKLLFAVCDQPRRGGIEDKARAFDFGQEWRDAGLLRGAFGPR